MTDMATEIYFSNNMSAMAELAAGNNHFPALGEQNPYGVFDAVARDIDLSAFVTAYSDYTALYAQVMKQYIDGDKQRAATERDFLSEL
jgi:hypothetical protein